MSIKHIMTLLVGTAVSLAVIFGVIWVFNRVPFVHKLVPSVFRES